MSGANPPISSPISRRVVKHHFQSKGSDLSIAYETTVEPFLRSGVLQKCDITKIKMREVYLIPNKRNARPDMTRRLIDLLSIMLILPSGES